MNPRTNGIHKKDIQMKYKTKRMYQIPNSPKNKSSLIHHQKQYSDYHVINPNQNQNEKIIHRSIQRNFDPKGNAIITTKIVREIDYDNNNNINSNSIMNIRPKALNSSFGRNNELKSEVLRYSNYSNNEEIENASAVYNNRNYGYDVISPNTYESQENNYTKINTYSASGESDGGREYYSALRSPMTGKIINLKRGEISPMGLPNYTSGSEYDEINQIGNNYIPNPNLNYSQKLGVNKYKYRRYNLESPYTQNDDFDSPDRGNDINGPFFRNIQIDKIKGIQPIYQEKSNMINNQVEISREYDRDINRLNWKKKNNSSNPGFYRQYSDKRYYELLNDAAIKLQANIRGYLVKKKVFRFITLALYYQSFCDKIKDTLVFHVRGDVFDILKKKFNLKSKNEETNNKKSIYNNSKRIRINETDGNNINIYKSRNIVDHSGIKKEYTEVYNDINTPIKTLRKEYSENIIFNRKNRNYRPNKLDKNYCKKTNYSINYSNTEYKKFDYTVSPTKKVTHYFINSPCSTNKPHNRFYQEIDDKTTNIYHNNLSTYRSYRNINLRNQERFGHYKYNKYENNTSTTFQDKPDYTSGIGTRSYSRGMIKTTYSSSNQNSHRCHCLDGIRKYNINNENINIYREKNYVTRKDLDSQDIRKEVYTEKIIRKDIKNERRRYDYYRLNDGLESDNYISLNIVKLPQRRVSSSDKKEEIYTKTVETKEYLEDNKNKIIKEEPKRKRFSKVEINKTENVKFLSLSKSKRDIFTNTINEPNRVDRMDTINIVGEKKEPKIDKEKLRRENELREMEIERRIKERVEIEKREIERIDRERKNKENQDRLEQERKDRERKNQEEQLLIERERKIQIEQEKIDKEWKEIERREKEEQRRREQDEKNRKDWEEKGRLERERRLKDEQDRRDRERRDKELRDKLEQERREREKKEMEKMLVIEREKIIRIEKERLEKEMKDRENKIRDDNMMREREERLRREKLEKMERDRKLEEERKERERKDKERKEKEKRDRDEKLRIEREERIRKEEIERIEKQRKLREEQERRDREKKEREKKAKLEREKREEQLKIERERRLRLEQEKREKEKKEQEAKRKKEKEDRDRIKKIEINTTKIIERDRTIGGIDNYEKERKERLERILGNINNQSSQKTVTTTTKITTRQWNTDINRNIGNIGSNQSKYISTNYKPNIQTIKVKESGSGKYPSFIPGDEYILKKDCKKNLEEMKLKLEKEYNEKIENEKKRGQEELRINQENIERKNKREIERLIEMHKQQDNERIREIERERELSKKREMEIEKLKEKQLKMGLQIETDKQRELERQREIEERNRKKNYIKINKEVEINLKNTESLDINHNITTIKRDIEKDILRAKEIIKIFILSRCDPLMKKRKYFNVWRRKAHLLELLENSKIIQEFCRSNLEMSRIKKIIKMWQNLSRKLFYKTRVRLLTMKPKLSKGNIRIKKLYELIRITKLTTLFSRRRFIHFIILIWHIYAKNIHKKRVNMKYLYENLLKTYMSLANDIFGNNQYENPSVQDAMYEAVNTNKFITLMPDDVPLARKHYEEMRKIKSVDSKGNKIIKSSSISRYEISKKQEVEKKYYMGKINENVKAENNSESDDNEKIKKKKLDFLDKYRKNKFYHNFEKKKNYSYSGRSDDNFENRDNYKDIKSNENDNKKDSVAGTSRFFNKYKNINKDDKDTIKSSEKGDINIGTTTYLNRFNFKDDKSSPKSSENKIDSVIGTVTYLNRFKNLNKNDKESSEKGDINIGTTYLNRFTFKDDKSSPKSSENKIDSVIGTVTYLNRFKNINKDDKDTIKSNEKGDINIGTTYLNRFNFKDDKSSPKSSENKIDSVIGTVTYLNRFKNLNKNDKDSSILTEKKDNIGASLYLNKFKFTNEDKEDKKKDEIKTIYNKYNNTEGNNSFKNLERNTTNKYGYINKFRNKSDNKDDKTAFSNSRFDNINNEGKISSNYGSNVGITYSSDLKHTTSYNYIPKIDTKSYINNISSLGTQKDKDKDINIKKYELKSNIPVFDTYKIKQPITFDTYQTKKPTTFDTYKNSSYIKNISEEPKSYLKKVEIKTTTTTSSLSNGKTGSNNFVYNSNINTDNTKNKYGIRDTSTTGLHKSNTENKINFSYKSPSLSILNNNNILNNIGKTYGQNYETKIERKYETKPYRSNVGSSYDSTRKVTTQFKSRFNP